MYRIRENEIMIKDVLRLICVEKLDLSDMRLLYKDIKKLEWYIVESGKTKVGNNRCKNLYSKEIERLIINIILRWRVIKLGI